MGEAPARLRSTARTRSSEGCAPGLQEVGQLEGTERPQKSVGTRGRATGCGLGTRGQPFGVDGRGRSQFCHECDQRGVKDKVHRGGGESCSRLVGEQEQEGNSGHLWKMACRIAVRRWLAWLDGHGPEGGWFQLEGMRTRTTSEGRSKACTEIDGTVLGHKGAHLMRHSES
jgi:hypothetical protein